MHRFLFCVVLVLLPACTTAPRPGTEHPRTGDEILVAGHLFHTGAPVVLWLDQPNYDAYRTDRRFAPGAGHSRVPSSPDDSPNRYSTRSMPGNPNNLADLQRHIDQFVIHYDAAGSARQCFKILHDVRGLSSHFLLDTDGTIYQTLDLKERAWHATIANDRSIGIEIAHPGAFPVKATSTSSPTDANPNPLAEWYATDALGPYLSPPAWLDDPQTRTPNFTPRPARPRQIVGLVQGQLLTQYDFTDQQYDSLIKLTATLCTIFPELRCDYPRAATDVADATTRRSGSLSRALTPTEFTTYRGLLGHYHIQTNKIDPGPAFDWDRVIEGTRRIID